MSLNTTPFPKTGLKAVTAGLVSLSIAIVSTATTQAATISWSIEFFDRAGSQVGDGSFSYDDSAPLDVTIPLYVDSPEIASISIDPGEKWFGLTSFSATINGHSWTLDDANPLFTAATSWIPPESTTFIDATLGTRRVSRNLQFGSIERRNDWLFGEPRSATPDLSLFADSTFSSNFSNDLGIPSELIGGTWSATQQDWSKAKTGTPEPGTILGTLFLSLTAVAARKRLNEARKV